MLERNAVVIGIHEGKARLRFKRESACGACRAREQCVGSRNDGELELPLPEGMEAQKDDLVRVELASQQLVCAGLLLYGLPLAGFILGMMVSAQAGCSDPWIGAAAFGGLGLGLVGSRALARLTRFQGTPRIVRD